MIQTRVDDPTTFSLRYDRNHPKQKKISAAIVKQLIINLCLPMCIVETEAFREFMNVVHKKFSPIGRACVKRSLQTILAELHNKMMRLLQTASTVSVMRPHHSSLPEVNLCALLISCNSHLLD
jgi:hypothetical protein